MRASRKFRQGGVQIISFFLVLSLFFTEVKWSISKKSIIFQGFRGGPTFSRGGGGGPTISNCIFPIETHITCDFPGGGGSGPPVPPSGSALAGEIVEPCPDMNIKVAAFTVSEKSSNKYKRTHAPI